MLSFRVLSGLAAVAAQQSIGTNPYTGMDLYVQPDFQAELATSIATCQGVTQCTNLQEMQSTSTAFWVDKKSKIHGTNTSTLQGMLADAATKSPKQLVTIVIYDLPNRDCDSLNSVGEICCSYFANHTCDRATGDDCQNGLTDYKLNFVDPIAAVLAQYEGIVPLVAIIEPDSLPNLATNLGNINCANKATGDAYTTGIPYAVKAIKASMPSASVYLDAAHGGWLGWSDNALAFASVVNTLLIWDYLRGFTTNVANYQPLGVPCPVSAFDDSMHNFCETSTDACCTDPCGLVSQYSGGNSEYNYVQALTKEINRAIPQWQPHYLIDTSRNGNPFARHDCAEWCNPRNEGTGVKPSATTLLPNLVDATMWIKVPGESDGCTSNPPSACTMPTPAFTCDRRDDMCLKGYGNLPGEPCAPEAGDWYDGQIKVLAQNAATTVGFSHEVSNTVGPYQACSTNGVACYEGYHCCPTKLLCVPDEETVARGKHNSVFATRMAHAKSSSKANVA